MKPFQVTYRGVLAVFSCEKDAIYDTIYQVEEIDSKTCFIWNDPARAWDQFCEWVDSVDNAIEKLRESGIDIRQGEWT